MERAGKLDLDGMHQDELPAIKAKQPGRVRPEWLERRNRDLLRQTKPRPDEEIVVASPLVLGVSQADLSHAIELAWNRGATVFFADSGLSFPPDAGVAGINAAMRDWERAHEAARTKPGRTAGYIAAAIKKRERTKAAVKIARPLWHDTKRNRLTTEQIADRVKLSAKTLYQELGRRPAVKRGREG